MSEELSTGLYQKIVDGSPVGVVLTDTKNEDGDRPILYANDAFEDLTGYESQEVVGRDCRFLQGEETDSYKVRQLAEALEQEEAVSTVLANYRKDGELFYNHLEIKPVYIEEELEGFIGYQLDVTEMVSDREEKDLLLRIVKHDLGNDLALLKGWNEMVSDAQPDLAGKISNRVECMQETIEAVDVYRRLGKEDYVESVNVSRMLEEKAEEYSFSDTDIEVETDIEPGLKADAGLLLDNLYENLIRNVEHHADADLVRLTGKRNEDWIFTAVEDDGKGFPDDVHRLFDEGYRGELSGGMGLGLFIVDRISEKYGLELDTFDSELGGAGFSVKMPTSD